LKGRIDEINLAITNTTSDYDKEKLQERLAKLTGGVGVIKVGAASEVEMKELKYVVEDAVNATRAAMAEGVVPGGASTLVRISTALTDLKTENEDEKVGVNLVQKALLIPFRAIAENSGIYDISLLLQDINASDKSGYDFKNLESVKDMVKSGIIDPKLVVREAIMNAASISGSILTTQVVMCDESKDEPKMPSGMGGGMEY
jgi:chaperonin GroEL